MEYTVKYMELVGGETQIAIGAESPFTYIQRVIPGDLTGLSEEVLIKTVLDAMLAEIDPNSYMVKIKALIDEANRTLKDTQNKLDATTKAQEEIRKSVAGINDAIMGILEATEETEEPTNSEGGEQ